MGISVSVSPGSGSVVTETERLGTINATIGFTTDTELSAMPNIAARDITTLPGRWASGYRYANTVDRPPRRIRSWGLESLAAGRPVADFFSFINALPDSAHAH